MSGVAWRPSVQRREVEVAAELIDDQKLRGHTLRYPLPIRSALRLVALGGRSDFFRVQPRQPEALQPQPQ